MSLLDSTGTYKTLPTPNCDFWISSYCQKRWYEETFDDQDGKSLGVTERSKVSISIQQHRSKQSRERKEKDSLLSTDKIEINDREDGYIDIVNMILNGKTPGNILYEYLMKRSEFFQCTADLS